jgi:hypothetical protein
MNSLTNILILAQIESDASSDLKGVLGWLGKHWLMLLIIFIVFILILVLIFVVLIPAIRKLFWKLKQAKETKKYSEELLLRKHLATVARGGKEGDEAEEEALSSYIAEIKAELAYGKTIFKKERKNIYDIPWFFMLGEPGCGKSTLMRRSGLDMPANIVDFSQGESGTSTFHWWFAPDGIILDIAGRILFSRWGGKGDSEWRYLIKQAKKMRSNHPLNGILITIPADSLIADNSELVKRKAKMLSDEIAILQKTMGLSLPVYVFISKMDYVTGFSDIFAELEEEERSRIFGWSGTEDSSFDIEALNKYFSSTYKDIRDYAATSMLSSDFSAGSGAERMKCVKSIYSFPDAFSDLKENLGLYLQTIFGFTNWSGKKSLLFRGVYFTSALDYGRRMEKNENSPAHETESPDNSQKELPLSKPAFIHDVLTKKVFPEQGLAAFLPHILRKRRIPSLISSLALLLATAFILYFSISDYPQLERNISTLEKQWNQNLLMFEKNQVAKSPTVQLDKNNNAELLLLRPMEGKQHISREEMLLSMFKKSNTVVPIPWIYRFSQPWDKLYSADMLSEERYKMLQLAYADMVFLPVLDATREQFIKPPENSTWSGLDTEALATLISMDIAGRARDYYGSNISDSKDYYRLSVLFKFIFDNKINAETMALINNPDHLTTLHKKGEDYSVQNPNSETFFMLKTNSKKSEDAIQAGVNFFCSQWEACSADPEILYHDVKAISDLLDEFRNIEGKLNDNQNILSGLAASPSLDETTNILKEWQENFKKLQAIAGKLKETQEKLAYRAELAPDALLQETAYQYSLRLHKSYSQLQNLISDDKKYIRDDKFLAVIKNQLERSIKKADSNSQSQLMAIDARMRDHLYDWTKQAYSKQKAYIDRFDLYTRLNDKIEIKPAEITIFNFDDKISLAEKNVKDFNKYATDRKQQAKGDQYYSSAIDSSLRILSIAYELKYFQIYDYVLKDAPKSAEELAELVQKQSASERIIPAPVFPFEIKQPGTFNNQFHPDAAKKYMEAWDNLTNKLTGKNYDRNIVARDKLLSEYAKKRIVIQEYKRNYVQYWSQDVQNLAIIPAPSSWRSFIENTGKVKAYQVNGSIQYLSKEAIYALNNLKFKNSLMKTAVADAVLFYQTQLSLLTSEFSKQSESCVMSWQALPESQKECCEYMMGLSDKKIATSLFSVYSTNPKTSLLWWNDFVMTATEALNKHIADYVIARARNFADVYRQFPLCNTEMRNNGLTLAEVEAASIKLSQYLKLPPGTSLQALSKTPSKAPLKLTRRPCR